MRRALVRLSQKGLRTEHGEWRLAAKQAERLRRELGLTWEGASCGCEAGEPGKLSVAGRNTYHPRGWGFRVGKPIVPATAMGVRPTSRNWPIRARSPERRQRLTRKLAEILEILGRMEPGDRAVLEPLVLPAWLLRRRRLEERDRLIRAVIREFSPGAAYRRRQGNG